MATPSPLDDVNRKNKRIVEIQKIEGNGVCADCPKEKPPPLWVSFLKDPEDVKGTKLAVEGAFCVIVCDNCATNHHLELGGELCSLKYLKYAHEWTDEELDCLERSGNQLVNKCYEAGRMKFDKNEINYVKDEEDERRAKFIRSKYKKKKYVDNVILEKTLDKMFGRGKYSEERSSSRSRDRSPHRDRKDGKADYKGSSSRDGSWDRSHHRDDDRKRTNRGRSRDDDDDNNRRYRRDDSRDRKSRRDDDKKRSSRDKSRSPTRADDRKRSSSDENGGSERSSRNGDKTRGAGKENNQASSAPEEKNAYSGLASLVTTSEAIPIKETDSQRRMSQMIDAKKMHQLQHKMAKAKTTMGDSPVSPKSTKPALGLGIGKIASGTEANPTIDARKLEKLVRKMNKASNGFATSGLAGTGGDDDNFMKGLSSAMPKIDDPNIQLLAQKMMTNSLKRNDD